MKIGCCTNMVAGTPTGIGDEHLPLLGRLGCDFVELPLAQIMELSEDGFRDLLSRVGIPPCRACNNFFPAEVRLTGPAVDFAAIDRYVGEALSRARRLGARTVVFGSSGARNVPGGFSAGLARSQLVELLRLIAARARALDIAVVVEPLRRAESNIINTTEEGATLVRDVAHPSVRLLVDIYHHEAEGGTASTLREAGKLIGHLHLSNPAGRTFPRGGDEALFRPYLDAVRSALYDGSLSIEAYSGDLEADLLEALSVLRRLAGAER